jgi:hypothetical protein
MLSQNAGQRRQECFHVRRTLLQGHYHAWKKMYLTVFIYIQDYDGSFPAVVLIAPIPACACRQSDSSTAGSNSMDKVVASQRERSLNDV